MKVIGMLTRAVETNRLRSDEMEQKLFPDVRGNMYPAVWRDKSGVLHRAWGADQELPREFIRLMWTACGAKDIPANAAWLQVGDDGPLTCDGCKAADKIAQEDEREAILANGQFGVGA